MTINAINSSYLQSIYSGLGASTGAPAATSFALGAPTKLPSDSTPPSVVPTGNFKSNDPLLTPSPTASSAPTVVPTGTFTSGDPLLTPSAWTNGTPPVHGDPRFNSVLTKLQQTDPALAQKLQAFQSQIEGLESSGASQSTIAKTAKNEISSLTSQQQTELQQAVASIKPHRHHHGGGGGSDSLLNALTSSSSSTTQAATVAGSTGANSTIASIFGLTNAQSQGLASYLQSQVANADQSLFGLAA